MITLKRTNSDDTDFVKLVAELDKDLAIRDGADHTFYAQFNKITSIKYVVVAYEKKEAVGCGAIKAFDENTMEIKRMFVPLQKRAKGIASKVLKELVSWTKELGYNKCILETGKKQVEAIGLYKKNDFTIIENCGQYADVENSVCFEKQIL